MLTVAWSQLQIISFTKAWEIATSTPQQTIWWALILCDVMLYKELFFIPPPPLSFTLFTPAKLFCPVLDFCFCSRIIIKKMYPFLNYIPASAVTPLQGWNNNTWWILAVATELISLFGESKCDKMIVLLRLVFCYGTTTQVSDVDHKPFVFLTSVCMFDMISAEIKLHWFYIYIVYIHTCILVRSTELNAVESLLFVVTWEQYSSILWVTIYHKFTSLQTYELWYVLIWKV